MVGAGGSQNDIVKSAAGILADAKFWMQLVAVLMIIYGVLIALSIIGILIAWIPIWMGVVLFQAATAVEQARDSGEPEHMEQAMRRLKTYFMIMGILTLIMLIISIAGFLMGGLTAMMGLSELPTQP